MLVATMPMLAKTISLGAGLDLEYVESGARNGLPVIFLHGVTDSWGSFEGVLSRLPESIHAFAISQRGHFHTRHSRMPSITAVMNIVPVTAIP